MSYTKEFNPRYSSVSLEATADIINIPANKARQYKAGTPMVVFTDFLGRNHNLPYRTKKQYKEICEFLKGMRAESATIKQICAQYEVRNGFYVKEAKLIKDLQLALNFTKKQAQLVLGRF
jgi:hypothetical protein